MPVCAWASSGGYTYDIGKHEVTAGRYCEFLNAAAGADTYGLYNSYMARTDFGSGIARSGSEKGVNPLGRVSVKMVIVY